jgi:hypothetical protein
MTLASSRAVFLLVVQKADSFLRPLVRLVATFLSNLCLAVLRVIVSCVVFTTCVMVLLHYSGVPVPGLSDLLDKFGALGRLTRILS